MKVYDRGTMKWVSLMLPEHVEQLKEAFIEYAEKPVLDEQKMSEIDHRLKVALVYRHKIAITYIQQGQYYKVTSRLKKIDQWRGFVVLTNDDGKRISLKNVTDVQLI